MGPLKKRKAGTDERPSKKVKPSGGATPSESTTAATNGSTKSREESSVRQPLLKSVLQQEERAFPRGGASILTPIEQKQIKAQAEHDVLSEQRDGAKDLPDDGDLFDEKTTRGTKGDKRKKIGKLSSAVTPVNKAGVKVNGLSFKALVPGSIVLGCITAITGKDIALALPNNLTGFVPLTAISDAFNARLAAILENQSDDSDEDNDVDLKNLFYIGQWLRAKVTASGTDPADGKSKRHIELSLNPTDVNSGLAADNVPVHSMIQASVRSVEDHGIVMDLGLSSEGVRGFISKKELGPGWKPEELEKGQAMLCLVTGKGSNGNVLKLSPDAARFSAIGNDAQIPIVNEAASVDSFLPGTATTILITDVSSGGAMGKIMGMLDVAADLVHAALVKVPEKPASSLKIGSKVKARITFALPKDDGSRRVGVSLLETLLALPPPQTRLHANATPKQRVLSMTLEQRVANSAVLKDAKVIRVEPERGIFVDLPANDGEAACTLLGFTHISQVSDKHIDTISPTSGPYKLDSIHQARVMSFNPVDNIYYTCMKQSIIDQPFLRLEDLAVGQKVKGTIERLLLGGKSGITGILVKLSNNINGLVPEMHLSDALLKQPERKFRDGLPVSARVLSLDFEKRHVRLTLKKSLVELEQASDIWADYEGLLPGMQTSGTIINILPTGAVVQFFANIRAWLPVAEMSEGFVESPAKHLRLGQTVTVRILTVDAAAQEMKVSCKADNGFDAEQQAVWDTVNGGETVSGTVTVKSHDNVTLDLDNGLRGVIAATQLVDGASSKAESVLKKINVGQTLSDLVVLGKFERGHHLLLSFKKSLVQAAKSGSIVRKFEDLVEGAKVHGFVRNITPEGIYTEFVNGLVGLLPKSQVAPDMVNKAAFGLVKHQTVHAWVMAIDQARQRFTLTMREPVGRPAFDVVDPSNEPASHAVESSIATVADLTSGKLTKARVAAVKGTQLNMQIADNIQGRIDVSEAFDSWAEIINKKAPLQKFKPGDIVSVKVLGLHDARNHRFLPISHRQSRNMVFELTAKKSRFADENNDLLTFDSITAGSTYTAFVNNHGEDCVWVNLSPNVRGRIALIDLTDDVGALHNIPGSFPVGAALQVKVKRVDPIAQRLDLSSRSGLQVDEEMTLSQMIPGLTMPARITKLTERSVHVQLNENISGPVPLVELSDDYANINIGQYHKNDIVRVSVIDVDQSKKKLYLSLRPSKTLSSSLPVVDPQVTNVQQLKAGDLVRGFVKNIAEKGVFVSLGAKVDGFVRVSDLTDQYVKDWSTIVQLDQLVQARVLKVEDESKHILLSLRASHTDKNYKPPISLENLEVGQVVTGKVRKVEDFGAFIDIDNTQPRLSGLCHRSEVASKRVEDVRKLYNAGDVVKAMVLSIDKEARKISLGLKASYFVDADDNGSEDDEMPQMSALPIDASDSDSDDDVDSNGGVEIADIEMDDAALSDEDDGLEGEIASNHVTRGLRTNGFDWSGTPANALDGDEQESEDDDGSNTKKRKRSKPEVKIDHTGELDQYGPRSVSDFERQLLGQPNKSELWIQYMAFQLQLGEIQKSREIAERALRTIHIRESEEKANIWVAWLNLEVEFGDEEKLDEVFRQACQLQDSLQMHEKLVSIYIDSGKFDKAEAVFDKMIANKAFRASPDVWLNYATFLMNSIADAPRARALLSRALQSVPSNEHRALSAKFSALEFRSSNGDAERGRTIFEGLVSEWPKWASGWDMWVDLERSRIGHLDSTELKQDAREHTRALYGRMASQKMKKRRAKFFFKKWLEFEEQEGSAKDVDRVKAAATEYVAQNPVV